MNHCKLTHCVCLQNYFRDCLYDMCELEGAKPILCEAIEAYVNECQDRGVNIGPWRNETFCRECWLKREKADNETDRDDKNLALRCG